MYLRLVAPISFAKASVIVVWGSTRDWFLGCGRWMIEIWKAVKSVVLFANVVIDRDEMS